MARDANKYRRLGLGLGLGLGLEPVLVFLRISFILIYTNYTTSLRYGNP